MADKANTINRFWLYGLWFAASLLLFWKPGLDLVRYSLTNSNASHVLLIPAISAWLMYTEQKKVFASVSYNYPLGAGLSVLALALSLWTLTNPLAWDRASQLTGYTAALVLLWIAGFLLLFGRASAKQSRFSLLFLFLTVPLPDFLLNQVIYTLQKGSADIAEFIFDMSGVPALREGFIFHLAHVNIEVAKECSGIRSSIALLILALLVGHLLLRTFWRQTVFVLAGMLVMMIKNGVRIATLTILAQYVDPGFLYGRLHNEGGIVFFLLGLALLLPVLWLLERGEKRRSAWTAAPAG